MTTSPQNKSRRNSAAPSNGSTTSANATPNARALSKTTLTTSAENASGAGHTSKKSSMNPPTHEPQPEN